MSRHEVTLDDDHERLLECGATSPRKSTPDAVSAESKPVTKITTSACGRNRLADHRQHKVWLLTAASDRYFGGALGPPAAAMYWYRSVGSR